MDSYENSDKQIINDNQKPKTKNQKPKTKNQKPKAKSQRPKAERQTTIDNRRETTNDKRRKKMIDLLGFLAAGITTMSFVPQAVKTIKTKDTSGISLTMYIMFTFGIVLWFIYGIMLDAWPIIFANAITGILAAIILFYKLKQPS